MRSDLALTGRGGLSLDKMRTRGNPNGAAALLPIAPVPPHNAAIAVWLLRSGLRIRLWGARGNVRISSASGANNFSPRFGQVA